MNVLGFRVDWSRLESLKFQLTLPNCQSSNKNSVSLSGTSWCHKTERDGEGF